MTMESNIFANPANADPRPTLEGLSAPIARMVKAASDASGLATDFHLAPALAVAATAIGSKVKVKTPGYEDKANIQILLVAHSSAGKTPSWNRMAAPLLELDAKLCAASESAARTAEANKAPRPPFEQLILDDFTPEALLQALTDCPRGLALVADEYACMVEQFGRYSSGQDDSMLIKLFNGDAVKVTRKHAPPLIAREHFAVVFGGIQPGILAHTFGRRRTFFNGGTPRLCMFWPPYAAPNPAGEIQDDAKKAWREHVHALYDGAPAFLTLSSEATLILERYNREIDARIGEAILEHGDTPEGVYVTAYLGKLKINVCRLALVNAYSQIVADPRHHNSVIRAEEMQWAVDMCRYFEHTQQRFYEAVTQTSDDDNPAAAVMEIAKAVGADPSLMGRSCRDLARDSQQLFGRQVSHTTIAQALRFAKTLYFKDAPEDTSSASGNDSSFTTPTLFDYGKKFA